MDASPLPEVLSLLERLVAFDTQNPPRSIDQGGIFAFLIEALGGEFRVSVTDHGEGCVSLLAVRGAPSLLFNVHVDTVPKDPGWTRDPHKLVIEGERAIGLGACDTKGAAACLVAATKMAPGDMALLFTSDEEAGTSRCVKAFLEEGHAFRGVVVAEPTGCHAVLAHRGAAACAGEFLGTGGHASAARALEDSAVHEAVRWSARALAFAEEQEAERYQNLAGIRFNLGVLTGGIKSNMIASSAKVRFGVRPLPNQRPEELIARITELAARPERVRWETTFVGPPLPAPDAAGPAIALARELGLPSGESVDFWTEASLFSAKGLPAVVYGPGLIAEAHTAGEWISLADLWEATEVYRRILERGAG